VLALSLLGASTRLEPSLEWLFAALSPLASRDSPLTPPRFEFELPPEALCEQRPRVTAIDYYAETSDLVICLEAKRGEDGFGRCSCPPGAPALAACSDKVLNRPLYWRAAYEVLELPDREPGRYCPISTGYQAVRSVAAALYLARGKRRPVFAVVFDAENPYFGGVGKWPGWPRVLEQALRAHEEQVLFRAISWQELIPHLPADGELKEWARVKHRLV
jgi:hypothetical protein